MTTALTVAIAAAKFSGMNALVAKQRSERLWPLSSGVVILHFIDSCKRIFVPCTKCCSHKYGDSASSTSTPLLDTWTVSEKTQNGSSPSSWFLPTILAAHSFCQWQPGVFSSSILLDSSIRNFLNSWSDKSKKSVPPGNCWLMLMVNCFTVLAEGCTLLPMSTISGDALYHIIPLAIMVSFKQRKISH